MDDWKLFKEWVKVLDGSFRAPGRNAVPLISNCLVHLQTEDLSNIGLIFLPPNTTSDVSSNETRGQLFNPLNDNHTHSNNSIQEPCPISKNEHFTKGFILDVWYGSEYSKETCINKSRQHTPKTCSEVLFHHYKKVQKKYIAGWKLKIQIP